MSKTVFVGLDRLRSAVAIGVASFNEGALSLTRYMNALNLDISEESVLRLNKRNDNRIEKAERKSQESEKKKRKQSDIEKRAKRRHDEAAEGPTYGAGIQ